MTGWKKNTPGCGSNPDCGCTAVDCTIESDDFTRSDNTDISAGAPFSWSEAAGSWAIVSNTLQCTSAGRAICLTVHPDGDTTMRVAAKIKHGANGVLDLIVCSNGSNTHWFGRWNIAADTISIGKSVFGTITILTSQPCTLAADTFYNASVCVDPNGIITACIDDVPLVSSTVQAVSGTRSGLAASGTFGTAVFDDFVFSKSHTGADLTDCACTPFHNITVCTDDIITPALITLSISGFSASGSDDLTTCYGPISRHRCPTASGSFDMNMDGIPPASPTNSCDTLNAGFAFGTNSLIDLWTSGSCMCWERVPVVSYGGSCIGGFGPTEPQYGVYLACGIWFDGNALTWHWRAWVVFQDHGSPFSSSDTAYVYLSSALPTNGLGQIDTTGTISLSFLGFTYENLSTTPYVCDTYPSTITLDVI